MLRRATFDDLPAIASLEQSVRKECLPYLPVLHTAEEVLEFFRNHVFPVSEIWVASAGTDLEPIDGFCAWREGWVDHLYIRPLVHNRGLGSALLGQAMATWPRLELWVFQRNVKAIRFYRARSFEIVEKTDGRRNEEREPDARMVWPRPEGSAFRGPA